MKAIIQSQITALAACLAASLTVASAATFTVTTTAEAGPGSLREAITLANGSPGHDFIHFNLAPTGVVHEITLLSALPVITDPVTIDGLTQPGSLPNSLPQGFNATNLVTLNGGSLSSGDGDGGGGGPGGGPGLPGVSTNAVHGLEIRADLTTVRGLRIVGFVVRGNLTNAMSAIFMANARSNVVESCVFGVTADTSLAAINYGALTATNCAFLRIGGPDPAQRNLLASNPGWQIRFVDGVSNVVEGNFIGLAALYPAAHIAPGPGVVFERGHGNRVGGFKPGAGNYISEVGAAIDHDRAGAILFRESHTNVVWGNWIGLRPPEVFCRLPEGLEPCGLVVGGHAGIRLENSREVRVGGPGPGEGNVIVGGSVGVLLTGEESRDNRVQGNRFGTHPDGTAASTRALASGVTLAPGNQTGIEIGAGAHDNLIGGAAPGEGNLIASSHGDGVAIRGAGTANNRVLGNFIGTDVTGTNALPNGIFGGFGDGVLIADGATDNDIGGPRPEERNLISGNHNHGVRLTGMGTSDNRVRGNFIGPDITGTRLLPYLPPLFNDRGNILDGVRVDSGATGNRIGGVTAGEGNLISGNGNYGVRILELVEVGSTSENKVLGNRIGTRADGLSALANALGGVFIEASENAVGAADEGAGNLISGNDGPGVILAGSKNRVEQNLIGPDLTGASALPNAQAGVRITGGGNQVGGESARNVISGNAGHGVLLTGPAATGNEVFGNYIGVDSTGLAALPNTGDGVQVTSDAYGNNLGLPGAGNVISGNLGHGVAIIATPTIGQITRNITVHDNRIGTDVPGAAALPNGTNGVHVAGASGTLILANHIAGNAAHGIYFTAVSDGTVAGNTIGANAAGAGPLGNGAEGIFLEHASGVRVGGTEDADGNRIAFNGRNGVRVRGASEGNRLLGNSIWSNGALGIDLEAGGETGGVVTPNDPQDPDPGANRLQNFPLITAALGGTNTLVQGTLNSTPNRGFLLELFRSPEADPSGHGEGARFLARTNVTTDASGATGWTFTVPDNLTGQHLTATATDLSTGDTSEFGPAVRVEPEDPGGEPGKVIWASVGREDDLFVAAFPTVAGQTYTVLYSDDLGNPNWQVLTTFTGTGEIMLLRVPVADTAQRFFVLRRP